MMDPTKVKDIPLNLLKVRRRAVGFWATVGTVTVLAAVLFAVDQIEAGKVVVLAGIILSIATWMSAMMSLCPGCRASFHEGYAPRVWPKFGCAHCDIGMPQKRAQDVSAS